MSLPSTGRYHAKAGDLTLAFDGQTWSGTGEGFDEFLLPILTRETARHQSTHRTLDGVARRTLDALFPGTWTETGCKVDQWRDELPTGAID